MNNRDIEIYSDNMELIKAKCSCGHNQVIPVFSHSAICKWCGKKINNNSKEYFLYQFRKAKEKLKNEENNNINTNTNNSISSDANNK